MLALARPLNDWDEEERRPSSVESGGLERGMMNHFVMMNRACASGLLDEYGLLGKVAVGILMVVVELEETEAGFGAFAAQRRGTALDLDRDGGIEDPFGLGNGGKGLGRERLL
jgi:hypothetical protein